jgi:hypothetical protein
VLIENSLTPALELAEDPEPELEFDEPELLPVCDVPEADDPEPESPEADNPMPDEPELNDWPLAVAEVRNARIRMDQRLIAGRSIEESSGRAFPTSDPGRAIFPNRTEETRLSIGIRLRERAFGSRGRSFWYRTRDRGTPESNNRIATMDLCFPRFRCSVRYLPKTISAEDFGRNGPRNWESRRLSGDPDWPNRNLPDSRRLALLYCTR